ncbi:MAG: stage II sporulation protein R, partial [Clostridia bacterium]|nr:stage II sporulation protein R [Clostridia bacterium]
MQKIRITFICCCIILVATCLFGCGSYQQEYLRIHVRANSNAACDQEIKYLIKDEVVEYLTPIVQNCKSKQDAINKIKEHQSSVNALIEGVLK